MSEPEAPLKWSTSSTPNSEDYTKKKKFIQLTIPMDEMQWILCEMDYIEDYEQCVGILIESGWTPSEEHNQRYDRARATPIEHDDDYKDDPVELESGKEDYLKTLKKEKLTRWLDQNGIPYSDQWTKERVVALVSKMYSITSPIPMKRWKRPKGTAHKANGFTRSAIKHRVSVLCGSVSDTVSVESDDDDDMMGFIDFSAIKVKDTQEKKDRYSGRELT